MSLRQIQSAQWWWWDGVMYKQMNTICKPKHIRLFALIINCTILMKKNSRFSRNVYTISDRMWCNKQLRHTATEKYENNGKGGYFRFDFILMESYILSQLLTESHSLSHLVWCYSASLVLAAFVKCSDLVFIFFIFISSHEHDPEFRAHLWPILGIC